MNIKNNISKLIPFILFGSGVINVLSASGNSLALRREILLDIFPLEFLHLSNFITLILGIALIVTSIHVHRHKRRAFKVAILLSFLAIIFNMTKGLDFEEASISLFILIMLIVSRNKYQVHSAKFSLLHTLFDTVVAVFFVFVYGVIGFWFIDAREFNMNFSFINSLVQTYDQLTFAPPILLPQTHYSRFFLWSLHGATIVIIFYFFSTLFLPVVFTLIEDNNKRTKAKKLLEQYGTSPQDFFTVWSDKSYFFGENKKAFVSYGVSANVALCLGDPLGAKDEIESTIASFDAYCTLNGWRCTFFQTQNTYLDLYTKLGFKNFKVGDEAIVDLDEFTTQGSRGKKHRNTISNFERKGFTANILQAPLPAEVVSRLNLVSDSWLQVPGRKERQFTLGYFDNDYISTSDVIVVRDTTDKIVAFANLIPTYHPKYAAIDLMRHHQDVPNGTMDYLFIQLLSLLKEDGYTKFSLGLAPLSGFNPDENPSQIEKAIHILAQNSDFIFSFRGLKEYKSKFAHSWEPRYLIYKELTDLPLIVKSITQLSEYSKK